MYKIFLLIISIIINISSYTQNLKDSLIGKWVQVMSIEPSESIFYDKTQEIWYFEFEKSNFTIAKEPFSIGVKIPYEIKSRKIISNPASLDPSGPVYSVVLVSDSNLILTARYFDESTTTFYFFRQRNKSDYYPNDTNIIVENKYIYIKHSDSKYSFEAKSSFYMLNFTLDKLVLQPKFRSCFGNYITNKAIFPVNFPYDSVSKALIIDFTINENGSPEEVEIVKGISPRIDKSVVRAIRKTKKMWIPVKINNQYEKIKTRYYFRFIKCDKDCSPNDWIW